MSRGVVPLRATTTAADSPRDARAALKGECDDDQARGAVRLGEPSVTSGCARCVRSRTRTRRSTRPKPASNPTCGNSDSPQRPAIWPSMMIMLWLALRPVSIPGTATPMSLGCTSLQRHVAQVAPTSYSTRSPTSRRGVRESAWCSRWPSPISAPPAPTARTDSSKPVGGARWIATRASPRSSSRIRSPGRDTPDAYCDSIRPGTGRFRAQASQRAARVRPPRGVVSAHKRQDGAPDSDEGGRS